MERILGAHRKSPPFVSYHGGHTLFDGEGEPEKFVEEAIRKGFVAFGFSEHMPPPPKYLYPDFPEWPDAMRAFEGYVETVVRLKDAYREELPVLLGVETEYLPDEENYLAEFLSRYPFDYVVGSVHFVAGIGFDYSPEWYCRAADACGGLEHMAVEYYRMVRNLVEMNVSDVVGHMDLIKIFASEPLDMPRVIEAEEETLEAVRGAGAILEVNARGLVKPCREVYPAPRILSRAQKMDIPVTLGDDSHAPDQVGRRLDDAVAAMRQAGYTSLVALLPTDGCVRHCALSLEGDAP